jgi:hypothetical protein
MLSDRNLQNGQWIMDNGQWSMDNGQWSMDNGQWSMENGQWSGLVAVSRCAQSSSGKVGKLVNVAVDRR